MRRIDEIILHCTATPEGRHVTVEDVDRWHKKRLWKGIGYHYLVYLDGSIHAGRPEEEVGSHCLYHNLHSIGVCYVGGTEKADIRKPKDTRTPAQREALARLLSDLHRRYPRATLHGHCEYSHKPCPCFDVAEYQYLFK